MIFIFFFHNLQHWITAQRLSWISLNFPVALLKSDVCCGHEIIFFARAFSNENSCNDPVLAKWHPCSRVNRQCVQRPAKVAPHPPSQPRKCLSQVPSSSRFIDRASRALWCLAGFIHEPCRAQGRPGIAEPGSWRHIPRHDIFMQSRQTCYISRCRGVFKSHLVKERLRHPPVVPREAYLFGVVVFNDGSRFESAEG